LIKHYKGIFHANPGGYTYTEGWSALMRDYAEIMDEDTRLRESARATKKASISEEDDNGNVNIGSLLASLIFILLGIFIGYLILKSKQEDQ
jgi:hydroxylamine dehydrogenase